ncbi:MAG: hypothetical protein L0G87_00520 [Renibacterium salmoninarum]|nr:hypothetical protein [Renibacterium salmoninarum]
MSIMTSTEIFDRTHRLDIHEITRQLISALGPTLVAALAGSTDRGMPNRWAKGTTPRQESITRLTLAHRVWTQVEQAEGEHLARAWFIGGNPMLNEDTPITAIRQDRGREVVNAAEAFAENSR